jgi:hypothetical protein
VWDNVVDASRGSLEPTIAYLRGVLSMRAGDHEEAQRLLEPLVACRSTFAHYEVPVAAMAQLRLAQILDLVGRRREALRRAGLNTPFELPLPSAGSLLRDYVLESGLGDRRLPAWRWMTAGVDEIR